MSLDIVRDPFCLLGAGLAESELPDRIVVRAAEAPRIGSSGGRLPHGGCKGLWEVPAAVSRFASGRERLRLRAASGVESITLQREPELPHPVVAERAMRHEGTLIGSGHYREMDSLNLFECLRFHGDALHRLMDRARRDSTIIETAEAAWLPSCILIEELRQVIDRRDPPIATIVKVLQALEAPLQELRNALRRILRRQRRMVAVTVAETVDPGCVQWLARQPGRTLKERAGAKQEIVAVVREQSVDTFENRILKKCLELCAEEAHRYVRVQGVRHPGHERVALVRRFRRDVVEMLHMEVFEHVSGLSDDSRPNYVLQFDSRYRVIWWAYQELMRRRRAEDDLWQWRHRIWSEILYVDLATAAAELGKTNRRRPDREVGLLRDPKRGFWLHDASKLPTFEIHYGEGVFYMSLRASMHLREAANDALQWPTDISIMIGRGADDPMPFRVYVASCASFLPAMALQESDALKLILRPHRAGSEDSETWSGLPNERFDSRILPWPTWGPDRIDCARGLILTLLDLAARSR